MFKRLKMLSEKDFIAFQNYANRLKHLKRTGWVMRGVPDAETVASHSWRMAVMALQSAAYIKEQGADLMRVLELCLMHDIAEGIIGDIVPERQQTSAQKISKREKKEKEEKAAAFLAKEYHFPSVVNLFSEYEEGVTKEARIVKDLDKLDMLLQADSYQHAYPRLNLFSDFMKWNEKDVKFPFYKAVLEELKKG